MPVRTAVYSSRSPITFPVPASRSHPRELVGGEPAAATNGRVMTSPISITHARAAPGPIRRLAREDESMATAQQHAAPNPPRIAANAHPQLSEGLAPTTHQTPAGTARSASMAEPVSGSK